MTTALSAAKPGHTPVADSSPLYRPEIDGLRAIAVLAVIVYHAKVLAIPGGFAGVDVFFVISGYLITGILLTELAEDRYSLLRFYERRVRRIFPALTLVLAVTAMLIWWVAKPPELVSFSKSLGAVIAFLSNLYFGAKSDYFSPALDDAPLLHTWSLAVEEQFYLAFPPLLALIWRHWRKGLTPVLVGLTGASLGLAQFGTTINADANFFFPLSRAWELLFGALAIHLQRTCALTPRPWVAALGLALIGYALAFQDATTPTPSFHTLVPVLGAALVLIHARAGQGIGLVLSSKPFVAVGLISYSAYLWHQPLFAAARMASVDEPSALVMWSLIILTLGLAAASWALVEQPFRRRSNRWLARPKPLFTTAALTTAALAVVVAVGLATMGNESVWRARHPTSAHALDLIRTAAQGKHTPNDNGDCSFNVSIVDQSARQRIHDCALRYGPAAVVMGDSHAMNMFSALQKVSPSHFVLGLANAGCSPAVDGTKCAFQDYADLIAANPKDFAAVLYVQSGTYLMLAPDGSDASRQIFRNMTANAVVPPLTVDQAKLDRLAAYFNDLARVVPVTILAPWIEPHIPPNLVLQNGCTAQYTLRAGLADVFVTLNAALARTFAGSQITYLTLDLQHFDMKTDFISCDDLFWRDGDHLSPAGEVLFAHRLLPYLPAAFR